MRRRPALASTFVVLGTAAALVLTGAAMPVSADPSEGAFLVSGQPELVREAITRGDTVYLNGTSTTEPGMSLWEFDGSAFTEVPGSSVGPYQLVSAEDAVYFIGSSTVNNNQSTVWSYDGSGLTEYDVNAPSYLTALPGGGIALAGGNPALPTLHTLIGGVLAEVPNSPQSVRGVAVANGTLFVSGGTSPQSLFEFTAPSTFDEVPDSDVYPSGFSVVGDTLYFPGSGGLYRFGPADSGATLITGTMTPLSSSVTEAAGELYFSGWSLSNTTLLYSIAGGAAVPVPGAPDAVWSVGGVGDVLYFAATPDGTNDIFQNLLYAFDGTSFVQVPGAARDPRGFFEFGGEVYFTAQVEGRTNTFGSWPSLFRLGVESAPTGAAPALAATGADASIAIGFAALLLLAGGVAVGIRRRAALRS